MAAEATSAGALSARSLRLSAQARVRQDQNRNPNQDELLLPRAAQNALHELRVHQIELEMQNDELRKMKINLDADRAEYFDLYDTAPVGYCTESEAGLILKANLTAAKLLGMPRSALVHQRFCRFLQSADQEIYHLHRKRLIATGKAQECELHMLPRDGPMIWTKLMFTLAPSEKDRFGMRIVISDISKRKCAEHALQRSEQSLRTSERQMVIAQQISGTGSWTYDLATSRIWGSAEGLRIFGYPPVARDFPIDEIEACIAQREKVHQALVALIAEGQDYDLEYEVQPADGSPLRTVHCVARLDVDAPGKPSKVLGFIQDITRLKQMNEQVRQFAFLDPLTQLPNRRLFMDRLGQAITAGQRTAHFGALMFLDLDNFKPLNDRHGHEAGDLLLSEVAHRLNQCVRGTDTVARIGGDEFVVLLGGLNSDEVESTEQAMGIAEKVRASLAAPYVFTIRNGDTTTNQIEHRCSASIGVVVFSKDDQRPEDILKRADAAMYQAKDQGRNLVRIFQPPA